MWPAEDKTTHYVFLRPRACHRGRFLLTKVTEKHKAEGGEK
jgi:hypothetical protein